MLNESMIRKVLVNYKGNNLIKDFNIPPSSKMNAPTIDLYIIVISDAENIHQTQMR